MKISSSAFENNQTIPSKYTCDGENINPPLSFSDIPKKTKSLVLIVDDPDAPSGDWVHWVIFDISPNTLEILENSVPQEATQAMTSFGNNTYGGPCPPSGEHHYQFKVYALDTMLDLPFMTSKHQLLFAMSDYIIDQAKLVGLYTKM